MAVYNNLPAPAGGMGNLLWKGTLTSGQSATLSDDPQNYKIIYVVWLPAGAYQSIITLLPSEPTGTSGYFEIAGLSGVYSTSNYYAYVEVALTNTTIKVQNIRQTGWNGSKVTAVYGIK